MSHGPYRFRESEVRRAIKAARSAGIEIGATTLRFYGDGFAIIPGKSDEGGNGDASNRWDEVLTDAADKERAA
jgi:hypothetical protein